MQRTRTRLKDIAVATGYSANTVSLALRGSPRIPEETRDRIQSAARSLNYFPNTIAQALVSRETRTIGLVLTDIMNPTLTLVSRFLERELAQRGYSLMLAASDHDAAKERSALEVFRSRQVDGILIYPTNHDRLDHIRAVRQAGYPVAGAGRHSVRRPRRGGDQRPQRRLPGGPASDRARPSPHRACSTRRSCAATAKSTTARCAPSTEAGLPADALVVVKPGGHSATDGFHAIADAMQLKERPTALFATTDSLAIGALRWCREQGRLGARRSRDRRLRQHRGGGLQLGADDVDQLRRRPRSAAMRSTASCR